MGIDIFFAILMVMAVIKGYSRGLIVAVFSCVAIIIGLAAAMKFSAIVAGWLAASTNIGVKWLPVISFALVLFGIILLIRWGANVLQRTVEYAALGWVNKAGGIILYAAIYITVYSILLFFGEKVHIVKPDTIASSACYSFIQPWGPKAINGFGSVIPFFSDMFTQLSSFFDSLNNKIK